MARYLEPSQRGLFGDIRRARAARGRTGWNGSRGPSQTLDSTSELDVDQLPELPPSWGYYRADSVVARGTVISYGIVLPGPPVSDGIPYIRGQDIENGVILTGQLLRTTPEIATSHGRSALAEGDVVLCIIRHLKVAIVPPGIDGANLTQGTVRMRPSDVVLGPYLASFLRSPQAQSWMKARYFGISMPGSTSRTRGRSRSRSPRSLSRLRSFVASTPSSTLPTRSNAASPRRRPGATS